MTNFYYLYGYFHIGIFVLMRNSPNLTYINNACGINDAGDMYIHDGTVYWDYGGRSSPWTSVDYMAYFVFIDGDVVSNINAVDDDSSGR